MSSLITLTKMVITAKSRLALTKRRYSFRFWKDEAAEPAARAGAAKVPVRRRGHARLTH